MKVVISILLFSIIASCKVNTPEHNPSNYILNNHRKFSSFTNPDKYAYLYNDLPTSLDKLCHLIKKQLVHPFDVEKFGTAIPNGRKFEDHDFPTVFLMLEELLKRNKNGLIENRKPDERLVVACVHHSMLLASILRYQGIPVRIRAGFAKYIGDNEDIKVSHVICEIWDQKINKWIMVDPDRKKVNFSRSEFEFSYETWYRIRNNKLGESKYISRYGNVVPATIHLLIHDLSYLIGEEKPYWIDPEFVTQTQEGISKISENDLEVLDNLAKYLEFPDIHLNDLKKIIIENEFLQIMD
ncbi:transglutaminase domain-containing protein [Calditrichota bacterium]